MSRYVFVFRGGAVVRKELSPAELGAQLQKWLAWLGELGRKGQPARFERGYEWHD
jgi:hypothetical protein